MDQLRGLRRHLSSPSPPSSPPEMKKEHADAPGRGLASASALWRLFGHGGVAAAAARRWLSVLEPGAGGTSWEEDEARAWALVGALGPIM